MIGRLIEPGNEVIPEYDYSDQIVADSNGGGGGGYQIPVPPVRQIDDGYGPTTNPVKAPIYPTIDTNNADAIVYTDTVQTLQPTGNGTAIVNPNTGAIEIPIPGEDTVKKDNTWLWVAAGVGALLLFNDKN